MTDPTVNRIISTEPEALAGEVRQGHGQEHPAYHAMIRHIAGQVRPPPAVQAIFEAPADHPAWPVDVKLACDA